MTNSKWNTQDIIQVLIINMVMSFIVGKLFVKQPGLELVIEPFLTGILNGVFLAVSFITSIYFLMIKKHPYAWKDISFLDIPNWLIFDVDIYIGNSICSLYF